MTRTGRPDDGPAGAALSPEPPAGSALDSIEAALGIIPARPQLPLPRWLGPLAACCVIGLVPWMVYLGFTLPRHSRAAHYDLAWLGFDCGMWLVLAALAWCALQRRPATGPIAAVAATLFVVDAWFDIVTAPTRDRFLAALTLGLLAELPLAVICAWVAVNSERIRARAYRQLRLRWERAIRLARAANPPE
ncbi:MAG: hypothetical protein ACR2LF_01705 [Jatrophihabitantaceae bacterium]